jgi:hypothetical protein
MVERDFEDWWLSPPFSGSGLAVSGVVDEWNGGRGSRFCVRASRLSISLCLELEREQLDAIGETERGRQRAFARR